MPGAQKSNLKHHKHGQTDFKHFLTNEQAISITKHARQRMNERNIKLSDTQWHELAEKISEARQKGITDALVLTQDASMVLSIKNNTIVTAMAREETNSQLFTNIDGAILINV